MQPQRRLGKGLGSLLESSQLAANTAIGESEGRVATLPIDQVFPNPDQPRKDFDDTALAELSSSISEKGVIQPILVSERHEGGYMIIAGERRYRASKLAGKTEIPAIVRNYSTEEIMEVALIENLQREDLNPLEEALAFKNLIERFNMSQEDIAQKIGKNRSTVANGLRLLKLSPVIQEAIAQNKISAGHARALLAIKDSTAEQEALFSAIISEGLSVRDAEARTQAVNGIGGHADILGKSKGATIKKHDSEEKKESEKRSPELWDLEQKLIIALGTKVQIKGDDNSGRIEIAYYSLDDLERIHEVISKNK